MSDPVSILIGGKDKKQVRLNARMANRHGMIAGATGTGKTVTLQILAEGFSKIGVPVFMADMKGDLSGLATQGKPHPKIDERVNEIDIKDYASRAFPVLFWDILRKFGHPVRTTISDIGPLLLSNLLELNDTQSGVLYSCFKIADDDGMLLLDIKDLRSLLRWMDENKNELKSDYGNIAPASLGAIQRKLLVLEEQGAENFLGEPGLDVKDLMQTDFSGNGVISVLDVTKLVSKYPRLYSTFLLWLLSELFEILPEVGDLDRPKFVLFFDEAHMLFDQAPKVLVDKVEQVVRLIRSKGVGVYFISQSPLDIPEDILGQLGMRIQHALRAFTPKDKKTVRAVAQTFRENEDINVEEVITQLGIGEALVSVLDEKGSPTPVEQIFIRPPESQMGPISAEERARLIERSPLKAKYNDDVDRESAYEVLKERAESQEINEEVKKDPINREEAEQKQMGRNEPRATNRQSAGEAFIKSAVRAIGSQLGRQIIRGILGSMFGKR
jgi:uncharacterized protein